MQHPLEKFLPTYAHAVFFATGSVGQVFECESYILTLMCYLCTYPFIRYSSYKNSKYPRDIREYLPFPLGHVTRHSRHDFTYMYDRSTFFTEMREAALETTTRHSRRRSTGCCLAEIHESATNVSFFLNPSKTSTVKAANFIRIRTTGCTTKN